MEPFSNRLCGRSKEPIHSIFNSIPYALEQVKNGYDYIIRGAKKDELLDRMNLSIKNGWHDEKNRVFIRYKVADLTEAMGRLENIGLPE